MESEERGSGKKTKLTRLGSFSSEEVFHAWATDSLLKPKTIETLIGIHQVDSLPAVLALRNRDIANLGLPIGQARLFQEAVIKLHAEYKYEEPYSPAIKVDVEIPSYKSLLDDTRSPVDRLTGKGNYFRFHNLEASEVASEPEETFCGEICLCLFVYSSVVPRIFHVSGLLFWTSDLCHASMSDFNSSQIMIELLQAFLCH